MQPTPTGIIVVDACALHDLQHGIAHSFFDGQLPAGQRRPSHYHDLLAFLGRQGWRVFIPEVVAHETGGVLLGAPNTDELFNNSARHRNGTMHREAVMAFLERVRYHELPGLKIVPADPATPEGAYLKSLQEIAADATLHSAQKRYRLVQAQRHDSPHAGERACFHDIACLLDSPHSQGVPVFFLSSDKGALKEAEHRFGDRVARLNVKGFLAGFFETKIAPPLQLRGDEVDTVFRDLMRQDGRCDPNERQPLLIDASRPSSQAQDLPFQKAMTALAQALGPAPNGNTETPLSRAEQFRRKWNWSARSGSDSGTPR